MYKRAIQFAVILSAVLVPFAAQGQQCDAHFTFDGNLSDSSGNGYDGVMIGKDGVSATPVFVQGRAGQALQLDGTSAMRAFVDLQYESCPQVTIAAWIDFGSALQSGSQSILSTGSGTGPGLRSSSDSLVLNGTANGLIQHKAIRPNGGWMFVVGVYDYAVGTYKLYWRNRNAETALSEHRRTPEEALWIGAFNDSLANPASGIVIDDVKIFGRALSADEVRALQVGELEESLAATQSRQSSSGALPAGAPGTTGLFDQSGSSNEATDAMVASRQGSGPIDMTTDTGLPSQAPGTEDLFDRSGPSNEATDEMVASRQGSGPIDMSYDSEEEGIAAAEAARERRELEAREAQQAQSEPDGPSSESNPSVPRLVFSGLVLRMSGISGAEGDWSERMIYTDTNQIPYWLETRENYDKPCRVFVHRRRPVTGNPPSMFDMRQAHEVDACGEGLPRINPLTTLANSVPLMPGDVTPITDIQVCNNGINKRVKGIRARVRNVDYPTGNPEFNYQTVVFFERTNCAHWESMASCPSSTFAVGVTLHFRDGDINSPRDFLSGVELVCSGAEWIAGGG
jgi:hypothetical protein